MRCIYCKKEAGLFRKVHPECKAQHFGSEAEVQLLGPKDIEGHSVLLKKGVEVWNEWRQRHPDLKPDLRQALLVHAKLSGANLCGADLEGAQLKGADLREADIESARLHKANLRRAQLNGAYLEQADLSEADLSGADLRQARMSVSNLHDAKLVKARMSGASLVGTTLRNADLSGADLEGCKIRGADARGASFFQAGLKGVQFQQSNLSGARLSEADLSQSDLSGCDLASSDLVEAKLARASLRWADLDRASLSRADLSQADCRNAHFYRSSLQDASLQGADLSEALLIEANLDRADLQGCRISRLLLRGVPQAGQPQGRMLISGPGEPSIQVGSLEVAQFVQTLVMSSPIKGLLDSARSRLVPVMGRFSGNGERAEAANSLWEAAERRGLVPVLIDWPDDNRESLPEAVSALAEVACCLIVDCSQAEGLCALLAALLKDLPWLPVQPLLHGSAPLGPEVEAFSKSGQSLNLIRYEDPKELRESFQSTSLALP